MTKNAILTSLAAGGILLAVPVALGNAYGFSDEVQEDSAVSSVQHSTDRGGIQEDDPWWSCVDDGNRICGPNNPEGKPAACYGDGGVIIALWPCHTVDIGNGQSDVVADPGSPDYDEGLTY